MPPTIIMPSSSIISIIIPTYNSQKTILRAIESVLAQSYLPCEIIVVDDGSTDETRSALDKHIKSKKIKYFFQQNRGQGAARNYGVLKSNGNWIAFFGCR
jgi:glycosyltransferase involved in cell wall biosynthesis